MVHQLLLCSSISQSNYIQTVSTLQALTGVLHPQDIATYTLLTKPHNVFKPKFEPGKVNQIEQYYMKCSTTWNDEAALELNLSQPIIAGKSDIRVERLFSGKKVKHWTLQISDIPNAGKNPVLAHNFYESTLVHHHTGKNVLISSTLPKVETSEEAKVEAKVEAKDEAKEEKKDDTKEAEKEEAKDDDIMQIDGPAKEDSTEKDKGDEDLMEIEPEGLPKTNGEGAEVTEITDIPDFADIPDSKETNEGDAIKKEEEKEPKTQVGETNSEVKDSFLQFLEELGYDVVNQYWQKGIRFFHGDIVIEIFKILVRDDDPSGAAEDLKLKLKLLDESNTFQIKAFINYQKGASVDLVNQGTKDLVKIKELLHNLFELEVPDRMYMDARVNRNQ